VNWQNRGWQASRSIPNARNPFTARPPKTLSFTLIRRMARFNDGRTMVYGQYGGGDLGQPAVSPKRGLQAASALRIDPVRRLMHRRWLWAANLG